MGLNQIIEWEVFSAELDTTSAHYSVFRFGKMYTTQVVQQNRNCFWNSVKVRYKMLGFEPMNDRLLKLRCKEPFSNLTLISAQAPTDDASEVEKDLFFTKLEDVTIANGTFDSLQTFFDIRTYYYQKEFLTNFNNILHRFTYGFRKKFEIVTNRKGPHIRQVGA